MIKFCKIHVSPRHIVQKTLHRLSNLIRKLCEISKSLPHQKICMSALTGFFFSINLTILLNQLMNHSNKPTLSSQDLPEKSNKKTNLKVGLF